MFFYFKLTPFKYYVKLKTTENMKNNKKTNILKVPQFIVENLPLAVNLILHSLKPIPIKSTFFGDHFAKIFFKFR